MPVPPACQKTAAELKALQDEKNALSEDLKLAAPGEKSAIMAEIKKLASQVTKKQGELNDCIAKNTPKTPTTNPCLPLKKELQALVAALQKEVKAAVEDLQKELSTAAPGQKPAILKEIKQTAAEVKAQSPLTPQINAKRKQYNDCLAANGLKPALNATFTGKATFTTSDPDASGPFERSVTIGLYFSELDNKFVSVTSFPTISVSYPTPIGEVTTTVSLNGTASGTFDSVASSISLTVPLFFHHSTDFAGDSTLTIKLTSTAPIAADGKVTVSGSAVFKDGYLGGETCWLTVVGKISPRP